MGIFYKVPISGVTWGRCEFYEIVRSLLGSRSRGAAGELLACIKQQFHGRVTLVNSGRSALELALHSIRQRALRPTATVLTPSLICRAVPDKIIAAGLAPVFYDVSRDLSPSLESLRSVLRSDTVAIVFPYLYGNVVPADNVAEICKNQGIALIEDCAASFLLADPYGCLSGSRGDYVIFSFQRGKTAVAGGGGALLQHLCIEDNHDVQHWTARELRKLHCSKITFMLEEVFLKTGYLAQRTTGLPLDFGRCTMGKIREMSDLDCRLVLRQIQKWPGIFDAKVRVLERYKSNLAGTPSLQLPQTFNSSFVNRLFVKFSRPIVSRPAPHAWISPVADYMRKRGIEVHFSYFPVHRMPEFAQFSDCNLLITDELYESLLEIPSQPSLRDDEVDYVSESLLECAKVFRNGATDR